MIRRFELFTTAIAGIYKNVQRIKNAEMTEFGLKGTHVMCLFQLQQHPEGLTLSQLASLCEEDKAGTSRSVSRLLQKGYVAYAADKEEKKYKIPLILTDYGRQTAAKINQIIIHAVTIGGKGLSDEERSAFYHALLLIADNLKDYVPGEE